jgi:hypothetical protein
MRTHPLGRARRARDVAPHRLPPQARLMTHFQAAEETIRSRRQKRGAGGAPIWRPPQTSSWLSSSCQKHFQSSMQPGRGAGGDQRSRPGPRPVYATISPTAHTTPPTETGDALQEMHVFLMLALAELVSATVRRLHIKGAPP